MSAPLLVLPLADAPPWLNLDVLLVLVMALIAVIGRITQGVRAYRKRTAAMERKHEQVDRVEFAEQRERGSGRQEGMFAELREAFREPEPPVTEARPAAPVSGPVVPRGPVRLPLREPPPPVRIPEVHAAPPPRVRPPRQSSAPATTARGRARSTRSALSRDALRLLSGNRELLREAILLREILDLPPGLRGPWGARLTRRWTRG